MSRVVTGHLRLDMRRVELASVTRTAVEAVKPAAEAKELTIALDLPIERRHDLGRSGPPAADRVEPAHQLGEVHAEGRPHPRDAASRRLGRRAPGEATAASAWRGAAAARVRTIPAGRVVRIAHARRAGNRARARAASHGDARRHRRAASEGENRGATFTLRFPMLGGARAVLERRHSRRAIPVPRRVRATASPA